MQLNIDNYLAKLESNGTLIFSDEEIYTYSPVDTSLDEYGKVLLETEISNRLFEFSITENFCDYGIVYSNDHTVGKISNATVDITQGAIYNTLENIISRENTNDGWCTNLNGNFKRLYYVKRINPNAILVTSFYTEHLKDTFKHLDYLEDMSIELINQDNQIIYSSSGSEIGSTLDGKLLSIVGDNVSTSIVDSDYVISINTCGDDWKIVSYIPTSTVIKENSSIVVSITLVVCILLIVSILATIVLFKRSSSKIDNTVHGLIEKADFDQLTNVLNKNAFYEHTENILDTCKVTDSYAFLMLDVDNFKGVNDTLGHIYGDKVLANVGAILRKNFPMEKRHIVGRLGGDEFAVFINIPDDITDVYKYVEDKCKSVCEDFAHNYSGDNHDYKISASIGVAMYPKHGKKFESLYNSADTALYHSKRRGKDTFTIYNSSLESGEN
jgi:diguanylate cyclase (GGDEF)-like protein